MSEKGAIKKSTAQAICDAIKTKEGSIDPIPFNEVANRITALPSGGDNKLTQLIDRSITDVTEKDLEGVTTIGDSAFEKCRNITNVAIPEGVTTIGNSAFYECTKLAKLTLPVSLTTINSSAFTYANAIEETYYNGEPWQWCKIRRDGGRVGNLYLKNKLFENLVLEPTPEAYQGSYKVTVIGAYSFYFCKSLKTVTIKGASNRYNFAGAPNNSSLSYAFGNCENLVSVEIGTKKFGGGTSTDTYLLNNIFSNCPNLTDIYVCWSEGEIRNAPWGATNATIHYNTPILFYIGDTEYRGLVTMTFEEWVNSEYNTGGFYVNENGYIQNIDGLFVKYYVDWNGVWTPASSTYEVGSVYKYSLEA